jgi:hypothetical protein
MPGRLAGASQIEEVVFFEGVSSFQNSIYTFFLKKSIQKVQAIQLSKFVLQLITILAKTN